MREEAGNLWEFYEQNPTSVACITTNGFVKKNGEAVMGAGCAKEAAARFEGLAKQLGDHLRDAGNVSKMWYLPTTIDWRLCTFPVKHNWWEEASPDLIVRSAKELANRALRNPRVTFYLPRPGCGNGRLKWEDVKPLIQGILPDNVVVITFEKEKSHVPPSSSEDSSGSAAGVGSG